MENLYESKKYWAVCNEEFLEFQRSQQQEEEADKSSISSFPEEINIDEEEMAQRLSVVDAKLI